MNSRKLIGPAGALAELFARTVEDAEVSRLKLLFTGSPGIGKTELANQIAANLTGDGGRYAIESVNGRKLSVHVVADWQRLCATSCMFGTGWRVFIVNECDTAPADAQDLLLTFLDEMPVNCAFIATSNLDLAKLTPRFVTRLQRHEVNAPESEEIAALLVAEGIPAAVAHQTAFLCGGCVRAALLDGDAWKNAHKPRGSLARVVQTSFAAA
jgi:DNA polymerase III delta prime subunit